MDKQKLIEFAEKHLKHIESRGLAGFPGDKLNEAIYRIALASLEAEPVGCVEDVMPGRGANAYRFRKTKGAVLHAYMPLYAEPRPATPVVMKLPEEHGTVFIGGVGVRVFDELSITAAIRAAGGEVSE